MKGGWCGFRLLYFTSLANVRNKSQVILKLLKVLIVTDQLNIKYFGFTPSNAGRVSSPHSLYTVWFTNMLNITPVIDLTTVDVCTDG